VQLTRGPGAVWAFALLLLAAAIIGFASPDRSRLRPLSTEAIWIDSARVDPGQTVTTTAEWSPPTDVYVVGWGPWVNAPPTAGFQLELMLYEPVAKTTLFLASAAQAQGTSRAPWPATVLPGYGHRVNLGKRLTLRAKITNTTTGAFESGGAGAFVYFVPVEGN
jgi:hypothetical protein